MYKIENKLITLFAPAERSSFKELQRQKDYFANNSPFNEIINAIPNGLLILNNNRQIVFANNRILKLLELDNNSTLIGQRPGEALDCEHAFEMSGGCGTTEFCRTCGAVKSILSSLDLKEDVQEYRIIQDKTKKALDLRIWTTPLTIQDELFTIFALQDIQDEKRRKVLEKIFFHDILNTAGVLKSLNELLEDAKPDELDKYKEILSSVTERLIDEIKAQQQINSAENNELEITLSQFNSINLLKDVVNSFSHHESSAGKHIYIDENSTNVYIENDRILLSRVVTNMMKNALEASKKGQAIKAGCRTNSSMIEYWVNNSAYMKKEIQLQIFQRSFSTKGPGRGLGTYSIKLLTEHYLQGRVWFISDEKGGTTFFASIPLKYKNPS